MKREELENLEARSWDRYRAASRNHLPALLKLWAAAEKMREQWTNKHVVNTPLDLAVVEVILVLNDLEAVKP